MLPQLHLAAVQQALALAIRQRQLLLQRLDIESQPADVLTQALFLRRLADPKLRTRRL